MRFWIWALRIAGVALLIVGPLRDGYEILTQSQTALMFQNSEFARYGITRTLLENLLVVLLCFGLASGLGYLRQLGAKNDQQRDYLRRLVEGRKRRERTAGMALSPEQLPPQTKEVVTPPVYRSGDMYAPGRELRRIGKDMQIRRAQREQNKP